MMRGVSDSLNAIEQDHSFPRRQTNRPHRLMDGPTPEGAMPPDSDRAHALVRAATAKASPAERAAFLDEACAGDANLRQYIKALLQAHPERENWPDRPAPETERPGDVVSPIGPAAAAAPRAEELLGTSIGPYQLLDAIGEGGMGVVYRAEQVEPVHRQVALKVIKPGMDSAQVIARFEAERQALALMDHLHIARVLDAGTTASGRPYFAMELVEGVPITRYCDEMYLSLRQRLELFLLVCRAVQHAHQKGIIHRDLKPSNILVAVQDGRPVPKVIDFGLAKALHQRLTERTLHTGFGTVMGTLEYMAPEQADPGAVDIDTRADIYSLGAVLYELLTGGPPLDRERLRGAGLIDGLRRIREDEPPPPSVRLSETPAALAALAAARRTEPRRLARLVRGELDWIVMKALEKDRSRRYETANGLARDLERYLADEPVTAGPPSRRYRLGKFVRRNRGPVLAAALVLLALVGGVVGTTWGLVRAQEALEAETEQREWAERGWAAEATQRGRAEEAEGLAKDRLAEVTQAKAQADEEARVATAVSDFLQLDLLRQADSIEQADRGFTAERNLTVEEALNRAAAKIGDRFKDQPLVEAAVRQAIGQAYLGIGKAKLGVPHLERARMLRQERLPAGHHDTVAGLNALGMAYDAAGQGDQTVALLQPALETCRAQLGPDDPGTLAIENTLAGAYWNSGRAEKAVPLLEHALAKEKEQLGSDDPQTLTIMNNLASVYRDVGRQDKAVQLYEHALEKQKELLGPVHPRAVNTMSNLAAAYASADQLGRALPLWEQALEKWKEQLGPDHPNTLSTMNMLATGYSHAGQPGKAVPLLEQVVGKYKEQLSANNPRTLTAMGNLAFAYCQAGQRDRGLALFEQVLVKHEKQLGADHPLTVTILGRLACAYCDAGQFDKALPLLEQALVKCKAQFGPDYPSTLGMTAYLSECYLATRQPLKALPLARVCLDRQKEKLDADSPLLADYQVLVGQALLDTGQAAEAEPLLRDCLAIRVKKQADDWATCDTKSLLGGSLLGQQQYAAAEPLLTEGYEGLKQREAKIPPKSKIRLTGALERLVHLYEATGQQEQADARRKELEALTPLPAAKP
jgi:serine/threonine protein kinase/tetratricopeptide (TPR) repeat protein